MSPDGSQYTLDVDGNNEDEGTPACGPLSFLNRHRSALTLPENSTATASFTFLPSVVTGNLSNGATVWLLRETPEQATMNTLGARTEQTIACLYGSGASGIGPCTLSSGSIPPTSFSGSLDPGLIYRVMTQTQGIGGYGYHVEVNVTQPPP